MLIAVEQLVGAAEVAEILGVSRQRVTQLTSRPDFPAPVAVLAMGKVWTRDDVQTWADERDERLGRR
jgi:predicted DNA-binding transcriptional regulator AlpA